MLRDARFPAPLESIRAVGLILYCSESHRAHEHLALARRARGVRAVMSGESEYVQQCQSDFVVIGMQNGEAGGTVIRIITTMITVSIVSSWCNSKKIRRLLLFFLHWLG